jgi:ABC transporter substrate binding protein
MRLASRRSLSCTLGNSRCIANALRCSDGTDKGSKLLSKLIRCHVLKVGILPRHAALRPLNPFARQNALLAYGGNCRGKLAGGKGLLSDLFCLAADALVVGPHSFFLSRRAQLLTLAARHALPTIFPFRDFTEAGGMMSYGADFDDFRQVGIYTGRILKGANPAELPVMQASKFEFIINL